MAIDKASRNRASILIVAGIFAVLWVMINAGSLLTAALIYVVIGGVVIFLYPQWQTFGKRGGLVGIDKNWVTDSAIGFGVAVGFLFLGNISPFIGTIGIPQVQSIAGTIGRFIIIVIAAPIFEEVLFRDFILDFFDNKAVDLPFFVSALITSGLFAIFHFVAYGESLSAAGGSFISAGLAGMLFAYERKFTNSIVTSIVTHMVLNFWIGFATLAVIVG